MFMLITRSHCRVVFLLIALNKLYNYTAWGGVLSALVNDAYILAMTHQTDRRSDTRQEGANYSRLGIYEYLTYFCGRTNNMSCVCFPVASHFFVS